MSLSRHHQGHEYVYGFHVIEALLEAQPELIVEVLAVAEREDQRLQALQQKARQHGVVWQVVTRAQLRQQLPHLGQHSIVARCHGFAGLDESVLRDIVARTTKPKLILVLDGVQDPHNLGACLRSANGFGVDAVVTTKDRACSLTPVVRKVACGAAETTPFIQVTNLSRTLTWLQEQGLWLVGLDGEADALLPALDLKMSLVVVMGNEGKGMRQLTRKQCDFLAKIPMVGTVESFNVSVATAVTLYEVQRQRGFS